VVLIQLTKHQVYSAGLWIGFEYRSHGIKRLSDRVDVSTSYNRFFDCASQISKYMLFLIPSIR
jgi:hypothetical protein